MNTSFISRIISFFRYGKRLKPARDWFIIIAVSVIIVGMSVGWNVSAFSALTKGKEFTNSGAGAASALSTSTQEVQGIFNTRAAQEAQYVNGYHFIDPSH